MQIIACCRTGISRMVNFKTLLVMKLTIILLIACINVSAKGYGQKLDLQETNAPLNRIFTEIKKQTGYTFVYTASMLQRAHRVTVSVKNASVEEVLALCFKDQPLTYTILERMIVVKEKDIQQEIKNLQSLPPAIAVKGKITNDRGESLSGATVSEKGTRNIVQSKDDGSFTIDVAAPNAVLVISFVGFMTREVTVGNRSSFNITLQPSEGRIQEVVITALGYEVKKDQLGYASSRITGDQVANSGEVNLTDALGGKASGVRVSRSSGSDPGSASQILIRGQSTITRGTDPLIVLDGVPIASESRGETSQGVTQQNRMSDINPDDIASIQVLKGASAAALWGTRAANGVIVITTKKGVSNNKTNISFKTTYSVDKVNFKYPLQTTYGQGTGGLWRANNARSWGDKIADRAGGADAVNTAADYFVGDITGRSYYPVLTKNSTDIFQDKNYNDVFGNGHYLNNSLSVSSGDIRSNYFLSLSDMNQQGVIRNNSDYRRSTVRINASREMNKWLKISNKASYVLTNSNRVRRGASSGGVMLGLLRTPADFENTDYVGKYYASPTSAFVVNKQRSYRNYLGSASSPGFNNPLWTIYKQDNKNMVSRFINSAEVNITPVKWLEITTRAGLDHFSETELTYLPLYTINAPSGSYGRDEYKQTQFNLDVYARAQKEFSETFSGNVLVGFNYNNRTEGLLGATGTNFIIPDGPRDLDNSPVANVVYTDRFEKTRSNAGYFTAGVGLYKQLYLNFTGRVEAASTFGELSNNTFFYPSADIAWQFSDNKKSESGIFSFGKLRAAYGIVGIQPDPYNTATNFFVPNWQELLDPNFDGSLFGLGTYVQSRSKGNPYLRPERKREFEIGTDLRFLNNKLTFSATYYSNKTADALLNIPQAPTTGYTTLYANAGSIQNKGIELDAAYTVVKNKNWTVGFDANWSRNRNKVLDLNGAASILLGGLNGVSSRAVPGQPLGVFWGIAFLKDAKGAYQLDSRGFPVSGVTQSVLGDPNPDWRGAIGFNLQYKRLKLYALLDHSQGGDIVDATEAVLLDYGRSTATANERTATAALNTYNGNPISAGTTFRGNIANFGGGDVALTERWYTGPGGFFGNVLEPFVMDATWTRLREVTLSYRLSKKSLPAFTGLSSVDLEVSGRNLWVGSKVKNIDPDSNLEGSGSGRGIVYFINPGTKSYLFTLKLNF